MSPTAESPGQAGPATADDVLQLAVATAVHSGLTLLAYWRPPAGRRALGAFFAITGLAWNGITTVKAPEQFAMLARRAPWAWYRRVGARLTEPAPRAFGTVMTVGETVMAAAILSPDPAARLGLLAVTAFSLGITRLGPYTWGNPILAVGALHLARLRWSSAACRRGSGRQPTARTG